MSSFIMKDSPIFLSYLEYREVEFGGIGLCQELREGRAMASWVSDLAEITRAWIFKNESTTSLAWLEAELRFCPWQILKRWIWPVAKFLVHDWGDIVDSGIGLSYRPARLHRLAGRYDNPMSESTISPSQGLRIWLWAHLSVPITGISSDGHWIRGSFLGTDMDTDSHTELGWLWLSVFCSVYSGRMLEYFREVEAGASVAIPWQMDD